jgi:ATP-dependent DNA helicase DinG
MMTARYAGFLQRSLPPFWPTTDRDMVLAALRRLDEIAPEPVTVHEPALRGVTGAVAGTTMGGDGAEHPRPVAPAPPAAPGPRTAVTSGHAWTAEADEELRDGVELGLTVGELAESLEVPEDVIAARLRGLGLEASGAATLGFD